MNATSNWKRRIFSTSMSVPWRSTLSVAERRLLGGTWLSNMKKISQNIFSLRKWFQEPLGSEKNYAWTRTDKNSKTFSQFNLVNWEKLFSIANFSRCFNRKSKREKSTFSICQRCLRVLYCQKIRKKTWIHIFWW